MTKKKISIWTITTASLVQSRGGSFIRIEERSAWSCILEALGEEVFPVLTFHLFCCKLGDWAWKVRWGPADPEYGIADRSLGHVMCTFGNWAAGGFGAWRRSRHVASIPVTDEWVREHYPDAGWPFADNDDEMRSAPEDGNEGDIVLLCQDGTMTTPMIQAGTITAAVTYSPISGPGMIPRPGHGPVTAGIT